MATSYGANPILRRRLVEAASGHGRSTLYSLVSQGLYPRHVRIGPRSVGWPGNEVHAINAARIAGLKDDAIRELVRQLHAARKTAEID